MGSGDELLLKVRLTPRADRDELRLLKDGTIAARVVAPPVDGKANARLCRLLAKALGVPVSAVEIARGTHARDKTLRVHGIDADHVRTRLQSG